MDLLTAYVTLGTSFMENLVKLGWPVAVVLIAWLFRNELKDLSYRVKSVNGPGIGLAFMEKLYESRALAKSLEHSSESSADNQSANTDSAQEPSQNGEGSSSKSPGASLVHLLISPAKQLDDAWNGVYRHLVRQYKDISIEGQSEPRETSLMFTDLYNAGRLSKAQYDLVCNLYDMRNYAHRNPSEITKMLADEYAAVSRGLSVSFQ